MKRARAIAMLVGCGLLAGCVTPLAVTEPPVQATLRPGVSTDRIAGTLATTVRSTTGHDKDKREFAGAVCTLESDELTARFTTPAKVILPKFRQRAEFPNRGRPTEARILCTVQGKTGIESYAAADKQLTTTTNAGIAGAILSTALSGAIAASAPWHYPLSMSVQVEGVTTP